MTAALDLVATTLQPAADLVAWTVPDPDGALVRGVRESAQGADGPRGLAGVDAERERRGAQRPAGRAGRLHPPPRHARRPRSRRPTSCTSTSSSTCRWTRACRRLGSGWRCRPSSCSCSRCLLNLEPTVSPASINADHWTWMRRYRVWEANRKVFLYPENWLEPELRDGKSPFFRDLESELLKADITQDLAEIAYLALPAQARRRRAPGDRGCVPRGEDPGDDRRRHPARHRAHARQHPRALVPPVRVPGTGRRGRRSASTSRATSSCPSSGRSGCSSSG